MNSLNWKKVLISGIVFAVLAVMLFVGVYLVRKPQSQSVSSKADSGHFNCYVKWASNCDGSLSPANGSTISNLKPHFHWVYGAYDGSVCSTSLVNPPWDCAGYGARVVLFDGGNQIGASAADITSNYATLFNLEVGNLQMSDWARANGYTGSAQEPNYLNELKPNTTYTWNIVVRYRPKAGCTDCSDDVHPGGPTWTFTTPSGSQTVGCNQTCNTTTLLCSSQYDCTASKCVSKVCPTTQDSSCACPLPPTPVGSCQRVTASKDLSTVKIGDTVTFTGFGTLSNPTASDSIDKINFIISKDGAEASNTEVATTLDSAGVWKATKDFSITSPGSYSVRIRVHWLGTNKDVWLE